MADLTQLRNEIIREMYSEAEPGLDFDDVLANPDDYPTDWHSRHYLPEDREQAIFDTHTENVDLSDSEHMQLTMTCLLDLGPTNSKSVRDDHRNS